MLAAGALSLAATLPAAAATLKVVDGILICASGVTVATAAGTKTYDVEFLDGSCVSLFRNCSANPANSTLPPFAFTSEADAISASLTLGFSTLVGSTSIPRGCVDARCLILTPWQIAGNFVDSQSAPGLSVTFSELISFDTSGDANLTYARWTEVTPIPLPAGVPLVLSGLAAFAGLAWRKRRERRRAQA